MVDVEYASPGRAATMGKEAPAARSWPKWLLVAGVLAAAVVVVVHAQRNENQSLQQQLAKHEAARTRVQANLAQVKEEREKQVVGLTQQAESLKSAKAGVEGQLAQVQQQLMAAQQEIQTLKVDRDTATHERNLAAERGAELEANMTALQTQVGVCQQNAKRLEGEGTMAQGSIAALRGEADRAKSKLQQCEADLQSRHSVIAQASSLLANLATTNATALSSANASAPATAPAAAEVGVEQENVAMRAELEEGKQQTTALQAKINDLAAHKVVSLLHATRANATTLKLEKDSFVHERNMEVIRGHKAEGELQQLRKEVGAAGRWALGLGVWYAEASDRRAQCEARAGAEQGAGTEQLQPQQGERGGPLTQGAAASGQAGAQQRPVQEQQQQQAAQTQPVQRQPVQPVQHEEKGATEGQQTAGGKAAMPER
eukprot:scaffold1.g5561.t1